MDDPKRCAHAPRNLYEINTRVWLRDLGVSRLSAVPEAALDAIAERGFDLVWLMGVWIPSEAATRAAKAHPLLFEECRRAMPDVVKDDIVASPYAIARYEVSPLLGGPGDLADLRRRLARWGIGLVLDFVPNHTACDFPLITSAPESFVMATPEARREDVFEAGAIRLFHGKDPHFPAWTDTAQLDYRRASTRAAMLLELEKVAAQCDGVRCDMAMLILSDVFERTWARPDAVAPPPAERASGEFWPEAIARVRRAHRGFLFIAEAYWGTEARLHHLGFDYTYDKPLYDHVVHGDAPGVRAALGGGWAHQRRAVRFLENHDEERAARRLSGAHHEVAATVVYTQPGLRLYHHGQLEGARVKIPVQLARRPEEAVDPVLATFYGDLCAFVRHDAVVAGGIWRPLEPSPAWTGNLSHTSFVACAWDGSLLGGLNEHRLLVANLAPHPAQCRICVLLPGMGGRTVELVEVFGTGSTPQGDAEVGGRPVYRRSGDELAGDGLFVELPGHTAQILAIR